MTTKMEAIHRRMAKGMLEHDKRQGAEWLDSVAERLERAAATVRRHREGFDVLCQAGHPKNAAEELRRAVNEIMWTAPNLNVDAGMQIAMQMVERAETIREDMPDEEETD